MRKYIAIPAASLVALALTACSSDPNLALEDARSQYAVLQAQPDASRLAALEMQEAGDWLTRTDKAYQDGESKEKVDHLAYLTKRRIEFAEQTVALRQAEGEVSNELRELRAQQTERGVMVTLGDVLFGFDSADLKANGQNNVRKLAAYLKRNPERYVIVEGYTDSVGSDSYNMRLSERRANAVRDALVRQGVDPSHVNTRGYGKQYPVASNSTESGRAQNRRVEVTISKDIRPVAPRSR